MRGRRALPGRASARLAPFGFLTVAIALLTFVAFAIRIGEKRSPFTDDYELQAVGLILTLTLTQAALALAYDRDDDPLLIELISYS